MARMNWEKLLSQKRVKEFGACATTPSAEHSFKDLRGPFEKDVDQIIFSYPFRRLQDKTQVIPFPEFDFVHTRLTHSLEVASLGRTFGKLAYKLIREKEGDKIVNILESNGISESDIASLVAAACYAHDIGNPPFGHSGEDSISHFFRENNDFKPKIHVGRFFSDEHQKRDYEFVFEQEAENNNPELERSDYFADIKRWTDLLQFEGNANGFRILTMNCGRGINPTAALLGVFTKYPRESYLINDPWRHGEQKPKSQSKYGFFHSEAPLFQEVANELGLITVEGIDSSDVAFKRHPLTFLVEAADDIAYGMIDFEDGCRLKLIDFEKHYDKILLRNKETNKSETKEIGASPRDLLTRIAGIDPSFNAQKIEEMSGSEAIVALRSRVINTMLHRCFDVFRENYEAIMTGEFDASLIEKIPEIMMVEWKKMKALIKKFVYNYEPVLRSEASGFEVMSNLIRHLGVSSGICYSCGDTPNSMQIKFSSLLPEEFHLPEVEESVLSYKDQYNRMMKVLDYVSGMTDNYAISLYRQINGMMLHRR